MTYREIIEILQNEKRRKRIKNDKRLSEAYDYAIQSVEGVAEMAAHLRNVLYNHPEYGLPQSDFQEWVKRNNIL